MRRIVLAVLIGVTTLGAADNPGFQKLEPVLTEFRKGANGELAIRFSTSTFRVLRTTDTELTSQEAKALLPKKPSFPTLKITEDGTWIEHDVDKDTAIAEPATANGAEDVTRRWKKRTWESLGSFDRAQWHGFVEFALSNGLCKVEETRYQGRSSLTIAFSPILPNNIRAGDRHLVLNSEFGALMRLSPKYPPKPGRKGFVILLHDPHENVAGRFQTLSGLRALTSANPTTPFRFLVEGAYHGTSREIGLSGLETAITPGNQESTTLVHKLLARYLINTPTAYRLLYDRTISAFAIDDNESLKYPAPRASRPYLQQLTSIEHISSALEKAQLPASLTQARPTMQQLLNTAYIYLGADLREAPDVALLEHFRTLAKLYTSINKIGQLFAQAGIALGSADLQSLAADANGYSDEAGIYQKALDRNKTMAPLIIEAGITAARQMPIAFIGNYHTHGLVGELARADIGYIVIEPRPLVHPTTAEQKAFEQANHPNTRQSYLSTIALNMGYVVPTAAEVQLYKTKIAAKLPQMRATRLAAQNDFKVVSGATVDVEKLITATNSNGSLAAIPVSSGGKLPPPTGNFGNAFAYFDPGGAGNGPRFVIGDARDPRWKENDRYMFLSLALFKVPERDSNVTSGTNLIFYPDPVSHRLFFTAYDPDSKRIYCFEGDQQRAISLIPTPIGDAKGEQNVRTQIVELRLRYGV